ncbi:MAG: YifB family Mg chelatase-like AAA ATPase [Bacteroidales bacterium]|nr:YifB family Mg chelatase-like AAA ATPase [Bacteroidales bacterium]
MLVKTYGAAVQGIDAIMITIEVVVDRGSGFVIVGLPDTAVKESGDRVQSAIRQCGGEFPRHHVVVNMSPADVRKEGAAYDLPIAVGILAADGKLPSDRLGRYVIMGELSLDGSVLPIRGALPMAIAARQLGFEGMIVPRANVTEAAVVNNLDVYGVDNLVQVLDFLRGEGNLQPTAVNTREEFARSASMSTFDFADVKGQEHVKRALEVACAGGHNILMVGTPGSGKSMMAKRLPSILPPLTLSEALETTKIHSVAGKLKRGSMLMTERPFRSPHHTISPVALVGGGSNPMPGEISLAHNGILFLDEFPEFSRGVLEVMRQPLEDRHITISRARYSIDYPAGFMLVASMNPCPCGYYNHPTKECTCAPGQVQKYMSRISGPLMDRIDLQVEILPVAFEQMASTRPGESSAAIRERVIRAREIQTERFRDCKDIHCNAQMDSRLLNRYARPDEAGLRELEKVMTKYDMSARAYDRILKVARTIADLAGSESVGLTHIYEAVSYRKLDRSSWGAQAKPIPF